MKRTFQATLGATLRSILIAGMLLVGGGAWAVDYTWLLAGVDNDWTNVNNWNPSTGFPGAGDTATIPTGTATFLPGTNIPTSLGMTTLTVNQDWTLTSSGAITFSGNLVIANSAVLTLGQNLQVVGNLTATGNITLGGNTLSVGGSTTIDAGALAINLTGANDFTGSVSLTTTGGATIAASGNLQLTTSTVSGGLSATSASGSISQLLSLVADTATFTAATGIILNQSNNITIFSASNSTSGSIVYNSAVGAGQTLALSSVANSGAGSVTITESLGSISTSGAVTTGSSVSLTAAESMAIGAGITSGAAGISLEVTGANGILTHSAGAITGTNAPITLKADGMALSGGTLGAGTSNLVTLLPETLTIPIILGSAGSGAGQLELSQAELNTILGTLAIGSASTSGQISLASSTVLTAMGAITLTNTTGGLDFGAFDLSTPDNLTISTGGAASGTGILSLNAGSGTLSVTASGGITFTNSGNAAAAFILANSAAGNISIQNNASMTASATNSAAAGKVSLVNNTGTLGTSGTISALGGGAADITLSTPGNLTLSNTVVASGTGYVSLSGATTTQTALITAPGGVLLSGAGPYTLTMANVVSTIAGSGPSAAVSFRSASSLTVGTVNLTSGLSLSTAAGDLTLSTAAGNLTISQPISTGGGDIVLNPAGTILLNNLGLPLASSGGLIDLQRPVEVDADAIVSAGAGAVTFQGVVDADASANNRTLTVNSTGQTTFGGAVGAVQSLGSLTTNAGGTLAMNAGSVTTSGAQTYGEAMTLGANTALTGSSVTTSASVTCGTFSLAFTADEIDLGGALTGSSSLAFQALTSAQAIYLGYGSDTGGVLDLLGSEFARFSTGGFSLITIGKAGNTGTITFGGGVTGITSPVTLAQAVSANANFGVANAALTFSQAVTVATASAPTFTASGTGSIVFSSTIDGTGSTEALTLTAGSGGISFGGAIGGTTLQNLTITSGAAVSIPATTLTGTFTTTSVAGGLSQSGVLTAPSVVLTSVTGGVNLSTSTNLVDSFTGTNATSGSIALKNGKALSLGAVTGVAGQGITVSNGNFSIDVAGAVNAGASGTITLNSGTAAITDASGTGSLAATTINLQTTAGSTGSVGTLGLPLLSSTAGATINLGNSGVGGAYLSHTGALSLGTLVLAANSPLRVTASGTLTPSSTAINTGTADLYLSSGGGFTTAANLATTTGTLTILGNAGAVSLGHTVSGASMVITSSSTVSQTAGSLSGGLQVTSVGGATLNQANTLTSLQVGNSGSGAVSLSSNTGAPLAIGGITNAGGGNISVGNTGAITTSGAIGATGGNGTVALTASGLLTVGANVSAAGTGSVTLTGLGLDNSAVVTGPGGLTLDAGAGTLTNTGTLTNSSGSAALSLTADKMALAGGTITGNSAIVTLLQKTALVQFNLGSSSDLAASTIELSNAELATISTSGYVRIGNASAGSITISAAIPGTSGLSLHLRTSSTVTSSAPADILAAGNLAITSTAGNVNVYTAASSLAVSSSGTLTLHNAMAGGVTVGSLDGVVGLTSGNNALGLYEASGTMTISQAISAGTADLALSSTGSVTQTAALTASGLELLGTGAYTLTLSTNSVTTLAAATSANLSYRDTNGLAIGTVGGTTGINVGASSVTLQTGAALTQTAACPVTAASLSLTTVGGAVLAQANAVAAFAAANSTSGNVQLVNTAATLSLGAVSTLGGGSIDISNTGAVTTSGVVAVTAGAGTLTLSATGLLSLGAAVSTNSGYLSLSGLGVSNSSTVTGPGGIGVNAGAGTFTNVASHGLTNSSGATAIAISADHLDLQATSTIGAGTGNVSLAPATLTLAMDLGSTGSAAAYPELSDPELDTITTSGTLTLGASGLTGQILVTSAINPGSASGPLVLLNKTGGIDLGATVTGLANLTLTADAGGASTGAITGGAGALVSGGVLTLSAAQGIGTVGGNPVKIGAVTTSFGATNSTSGNIYLQKTAGGSVTLGVANTITETPANGTIQFESTTGAVVLGGDLSVSGTGTIQIDATGAITHTGGVLSAATVKLGTLGATTAVGASGAAVSTSASTLVQAASSAGAVWISNALALSDLGIGATGGLVNFQNTGNLTLASHSVTTTSGSVTLVSSGFLTVSSAQAVTATTTLAATGLGISNSGALTGPSGVTLQAGTGSFTNALGGSVSSTANPITISADTMSLSAGTMSATTGTCYLLPTTAARASSLGGSSAFNLNQADLTTITAATIVVGEDSTPTRTSGTFIIGASSAVNLGSQALRVSGDNIQGGGNILTSGALNLKAANGIGNTTVLDTASSSIAIANTAANAVRITDSRALGSSVSGSNSAAGALVNLTQTGSGGLTVGGALSSNAGVITLRADAMALGAAVTATGVNVYLLPNTLGTGVSIGGASSLDLTQTEIQNITAALIYIGEDSGATVTAGTIDLGASASVSSGNRSLYLSGTSITNTTGSNTLTVGTGTLTLKATTAGGIGTLAKPILSSASAVVFTSSGTAGDVAITDSYASGTSFQGSNSFATGAVSLTQAAAGQTLTQSGAITSNGGPITLRADDMVLASAINPVSGNVVLTTYSPGRIINLGTTVGGRLSLLQAELDQVTTTGSLTCGDASHTASVTVAAALAETSASASAFNLVSTGAGGSITQSANLTGTGTSLSLSANNGISLSGNLVTNGYAIALGAGSGAIALGAGITIDSTNAGATAAGAAITISSPVTGAQTLLVRSGQTNLSLGSQLGVSGTNLTSLTIRANDLTLGADVYATAINLYTEAGSATMDLGGSASTFNFDDTELAHIKACTTLTLGLSGAQSGLITVDTATSPVAGLALVLNSDSGAGGLGFTDSGTADALAWGSGTVAVYAGSSGIVSANATSATHAEIATTGTIDLSVNSGAVGVGSAANALDINSSGNLRVVNSGTASGSFYLNGLAAIHFGIGTTTSLGGAINVSGGAYLNLAGTVLSSSGGDIDLYGTVVLSQNTTIALGAATGKLEFHGAVNAATDGGQSLTVTNTGTGQTYFDGIVGAGGTLRPSLLSIAGAATIQGSATALGTTTTQGYSGALTLGVSTNLSGSTMTFSANVAGGGYDLTVTGAAVVGSAAGNSLTGVGILHVTGISGIYSGTVTTSDNQTYDSAVTLYSNLTFTSAAGKLVYFKGSLDGSGAARSVDVVTADARFDASVGNTSNLISALTVGGGTAVYGSPIRTSGLQSYAAFTAGASTTLYSSGGSTLTFTGTATINNGVTLTLGNGGATGSVSAQAISGVSGVSNLTVNTSQTVTVAGAVGTNIGTIAISNSGGTTFQSTVSAATVTLTATTGTVTFDGALTVTTGMSAASNAMNIAFNQTAGGQASTVAGATTLANTGTLSFGNSAADSIQFTGGLSATTQSAKTIIGGITVTGAANLDLTGAGAITQSGATTITAGTGTVGLATIPVAANSTLALALGAGSANLALTDLGTGSLDLSGLTGTATVTLSSTLTAQGLLAPASAIGYSISLNGGTIANAVDLSNQTGSLSIGASGFTFTGGLTKVSGAVNFSGGTVATSGAAAMDFGSGLVTVSASTNLGALAASGASITLAAVTLTPAATVLSLGTGHTNSYTVNGAVNGPGSLTVNTLGTASFASTLGLTTSLNVLTITNSGGTTFQSSARAATVTLTATTGTVTFDGALTATTGLSAASNAMNLAFNQAAGSQASTVAGATTLANTGTLSLGNSAADSIQFTGGLTATTQASRTLIGSLVSAAGAISLGNVSLGGDTTIDSTDAGASGAGAAIGLGTVSGATYLFVVNAGTGNSITTGTITADSLRLIANGSLGTTLATPINTVVSNLEARSHGGTIFISNTGALSLGFSTGSFHGLVNAGSGGLQTTAQNAGIVSSGTLTFVDPVATTSGSFTASAPDLVIGSTITASGGITLYPVLATTPIELNNSGSDFSLTTAELANLICSTTVTIGNSAGTAGIAIGNSGNMALGTTSYDLVLRGTSSPIAFQFGATGNGLTLRSGGTLTLAGGGAVTSDASGTTVDVTMAGASILDVSSATSLGASANPLQVSVATLRALVTNGDIYVTASGNLALGDGTRAVSSANGQIGIVSGGAITTGAAVATTGTGTDISIEGTAIAISNNVTASTAGIVSLIATSGSITRSAGTINTTGTLVLSAVSGSVGVDAGSDNASDSTWLYTNVGTLRGSAGTGLFVYQATGSLVLGDATDGLSAGGNLEVTLAAGTISTSSSLPISAGANLYLSASGTIDLQTNVTAGTGLGHFNTTVNHSAGTLSSGTGGLLFAGSYMGTGTASLVGSASLSPSIEFQGATVTFVGFTRNTSYLTFTQALAQAFNSNGNDLPAVQVNKSGGSLTLASNLSQSVSGAALSFSCAGATAVNLAGFTWTLGAPATVNSNVTLNVGAGTLNGGQGLTVSGTGVLIHTSGTLTLASLTYSSSSATSSLGNGTVSVTGSLSLSAGSLTQTGLSIVQSLGSIAVSGGSLVWDSGNAGGSLALSGNVAVTGGSLALHAKTLTGVGVLSMSSGSLDLGSAIIGAQSVTVTGGSLSLGQAQLSLAAAGTTNTIRSAIALSYTTGNAINLNGAGDLYLDSLMSQSVGALNVNANTVLKSSGAATTITIAGGATLSLDASAGALSLKLGTGTLAGGIVSTGNLALADSTNTISLSPTLSTLPFTYSGNDIVYGGLSVSLSDMDGSTVATTIPASSTVNLSGSVSFAALTLNGSALNLAASTALVVSGNLTLNAGTTTFNAGATVACLDLTSLGSAAIVNAGANTLTASGNVSIAGSFSTPSNSTLVMRGLGTTLTATPQLGNLHVGIGSTGTAAAISASVTLGAALGLSGDLEINDEGSLDVSASSYPITTAGNWTNRVEAVGASVRFIPQLGTVTWTKTSGDITILGSNTWYNFTCTVDGATIRFQESRTQDFLAGGAFTLSSSSSASKITITRVTTALTDLDWVPPARPAAALMWQINLHPQAGATPGALLVFNNVLVAYSDAAAHPITTPDAATLYEATTDGSPASEIVKTDYKWLPAFTALYSFVEDTDRNGKIDRIRVTSESAMTFGTSPYSCFDGLSITVSGYDINTSMGNKGFVPNTSGVNAGKEFYIYLKEKSYLDTGITPSWSIVTNTSLVSQTNSNYKLGTLDPIMVPTDTARPILAATMAVPKANQVYYLFSEPVYTSAAAALGSADLSYKAANPTALSVLSSSATGGEVILATYASNVSVAEVVAETPTTVLATTNDNASLSDDYSVDPLYLDLNYPAPLYSDSTPANAVYNNSHRVSDLMISAPYMANPPAGYPDYFIWPIWAKDQVSLSLTDAQIEALSPTTTTSMGPGLIRAFDGSQWLRDQNLTIQARRNPNSGTGTPSLVYDTSPASSFLGGLGFWLPSFSEPDFSGLVTYPNAEAYSGSTVSITTATSKGNYLWNTTVDSTNAKVVSGKTFEFYYRLAGASDNLYAARLDMTGTSLPANWYTLVRPFSFNIHDVKLQRGSVTILNNVIDPTKSETVRLVYTIGTAGSTTITVFTLDGDMVTRLFLGQREAGEYSVSWDGRNNGGSAVARGIYFIRVVAPGIDEIRKVLVVRK